MFAVKLPEGSLNLPTHQTIIHKSQATNHQQSSDSGSDRFFSGRYNVLICCAKLLTWTHSDASASHQNPIAAFFKENHILLMIDPFYLTHRMVGWVESSIDKHQLPQFEEHRKMISNAAVSCLSWPHELVWYIYDKPLHLIVFSNRYTNP